MSHLNSKKNYFFKSLFCKVIAQSPYATDIQAIDAFFVKFEAWLSEHWPAGKDSFRPGASDADISQLEEKVGVTLPYAYKAFLKRHDGFSGEFGGSHEAVIHGMLFYTVEEAIDAWEELKKTHDDEKPNDKYAGKLEAGEGVKNLWWSPRWIPIAQGSEGNIICIDFDPSEGGDIGQLIFVDFTDAHRGCCADNFVEWLDDFLTELSEEKLVYNEDGGGIVEPWLWGGDSGEDDASGSDDSGDDSDGSSSSGHESASEGPDSKRARRGSEDSGQAGDSSDDG